MTCSGYRAERNFFQIQISQSAPSPRLHLVFLAHSFASLSDPFVDKHWSVLPANTTAFVHWRCHRLRVCQRAGKRGLCAAQCRCPPRWRLLHCFRSASAASVRLCPAPHSRSLVLVRVSTFGAFCNAQLRASHGCFVFRQSDRRLPMLPRRRRPARFNQATNLMLPLLKPFHIGSFAKPALARTLARRCSSGSCCSSSLAAAGLGDLLASPSCGSARMLCRLCGVGGGDHESV